MGSGGAMAGAFVLRKRLVGRQADQATPSVSPTENELVRRAQRGDTAAFGVLVTRYREMIYHLAVRTTGVEAAEDLAQVAFLKAWEALPRFAGDAAFSTWLYRIALNGCYDYLRRRERQRHERLDDDALVIPDTYDLAATVLAEAEASARHAALLAALDQLPADDRMLLALRVGEGWSYERIAADLGLNSKTVGTRLFRIRAKLRRLLVRALDEEVRDDA